MWGPVLCSCRLPISEDPAPGLCCISFVSLSTPRPVSLGDKSPPCPPWERFLWRCLEVQLESSSYEQQTQPHGKSQVLLDNTVYCPLTERSLKNDTKHWRHAQSACRLSTTLVFPAQEGLRLHIPAKTHCPKI